MSVLVVLLLMIIGINEFMIRILDILFSLIGLLFGLPVLIIITVFGFFDSGSPFFRQERVGRNMKPFSLIKFRTMYINTSSVATHLVNSSSITPLGNFLRKRKLDELPQLWNVLKGDMSLVGPRPSLFNQKDVIKARFLLDVYSVRPGITGLSVINNIVMDTPKLLAQTDAKMIVSLSVAKYFEYIFLTVKGKGQGDRVLR